MERSLVLLRHAKSAYPDGVGDQDRPLSARGVRDAAEVGKLLAAGPAVDMVLCSPAARTRQTWEEVERHLPSSATVCYEPDLYLAAPRAVLGLVRATPDEVTRLVVVAHNPGTQGLALSLARDGDEDGMSAMAAKYPTAGVAELAVQGSWRELDEGGARLASFTVPRG